MSRISIIVPVYNAEKYITRCIDSILRQTFTDFELILVDDGSTDCSGRICDEFAAYDERVKVIHQENSGVSSARNNGVKVALGEFITFVDSDDWIENYFIERMYVACEDNDAQMAFCREKIVFDYKEYNTSESNILDTSVKLMDRKNAIEYYGRNAFLENGCAFRAPWAKLIKRSIVSSVLFPTDRTYAEDAACVYRWIWSAQKIVDIDSEMYYYFQNPSGVCHSEMGEYLLGNFKTEKEWISFFNNNNFTELYSMACKRYIDDGVWFFNGINESGSRKKSRMARRVLKNGLICYGRITGVTLRTNPAIYEIAFPVGMRLYWSVVAQINRFRGYRTK